MKGAVAGAAGIAVTGLTGCASASETEAPSSANVPETTPAVTNAPESVTPGATEETVQQTGEAEAADRVAMKPGVYVGEGRGFDWIEPVRVKITVDEEKLLSVDVIELELNREEPVIQQAAVDLMIPRMIESQSVSVDAITGATGVSSGIKLATRDALAKALLAGGSSEQAIRFFEKAQEKVEKTVTLDYRIVVAGMGGAGTMAALSAAEQMTANGEPVSILALDTAGNTAERRPMPASPLRSIPRDTAPLTTTERTIANRTVCGTTGSTPLPRATARKSWCGCSSTIPGTPSTGCSLTTMYTFTQRRRDLASVYGR